MTHLIFALLCAPITPTQPTLTDAQIQAIVDNCPPPTPWEIEHIYGGDAEAWDPYECARY